ncbi:VanW family protein [Psychrobacillus sp. NPDC058041]|uniref:VanW family protein n=1 Tax=Psychrobacillus sp. NPDC058041 TaxID=3346310 RepID=UPI0036D86EEA
MKILTKSISLLGLITLFIYLLLSENNIAFLTVEAESGGSTIGGVQIEDLDKIEITNRLEIAVEKWKENNDLVIVGEGVYMPLDTTYFNFDVESSVNQYFIDSQKPWFAFWKKDSIIHIPIQFTIEPALIALIGENSKLNAEETMENIKSQVAVLSKEPIKAVFKDLSALESERIAFELEKLPANTVGLSEVITALNEQVISTGEVFSFLDKTKDISSLYSDETADFISSLLYSVILQTDFEIVERHSQEVIPSYLEPGIEADIDLKSKKDLKFANNNNPAVLKMSLIDSKLLVELYSLPNETISKYEVRNRQVVEPRTIYRYSSDLKPGEENLIQEGIPGLRISVYRIVSDKKGPYEKEELVSQDYYSPTHRIVLKSSLISEATFTKDPDLEIDLNGDGLSDMNEKESNNNPNAEEDSENSSFEDDSDRLPEGSYYDKAGNIIKEGSE